MSGQTVVIREASKSDEPTIAEHLCRIVLELGLPAESIRDDWLDNTMQFIDRAQKELQYKGFVAELNHQIIGSVSCQILELYPMVSAAYQKGYIWGVYVEPSYRRQGIASQLMQKAVGYLTKIGCTQAVLHASEAGKLLYTHLGYQHSNEMVIHLDTTINYAGDLP